MTLSSTGKPDAVQYCEVPIAFAFGAPKFMHVTLPIIFGAYALSMVGSVCAVARDLPEEFKRWIETQCALPNAQTAAILLWVLMESGKITTRRVDGCKLFANLRPTNHLTLSHECMSLAKISLG